MIVLNIRQALYIVELAGTFTCTWPIDPKSSKKEIAFHNFRWVFTMLNVILLMIFLVLAIFHVPDNIAVLMQTTSEISALLEVFFDLILCRMNSCRLQVLIAKLKVFLDEASEHERTVIQGYIDRYKVFFSVTGMGYMFAAASFCSAPFFTGQKLPADGWIPFSIESHGIFCTIYVVEAYCVLQTGFSIFVDFMIAILFSFSAAKLDILGMKLRHVKSYDMLVSCIKEYQEIIRYVEDIKVTVEFLLIKTNATMACAVVCGAMPLIYNQSLSVISQFLPMVLSGCLHLFVISWPADDLRESSIRFAKSISDIHWLGEPRKTKSTVVIMMIRSQKAFLVTMGGVLPPLSLEYYARFLSTLSSYFMGMRTMIENNLLQKLIEAMKFYCKGANSYEKYIFQRYVDKCGMLYGASAVWFYLCAISVTMGTFFTSQTFPTGAEYPFRVDYEPLRAIIFVQQTLVGFQCSALLCTNIVSALLLLFAASRFEILMNDLRVVENFDSLIKCIRKYYVVRRYAKEVANLIRFTALISLCICGFESVFSCMIMIKPVPFTVKFQYFSVTATTLLGVFLFAWPADNLMSVRLILEMQLFFETYSCLNQLKPVYCILTVTFVIGSLNFVLTPLLVEKYSTPLNTVYFNIPTDKYRGRRMISVFNIFHVVTAASVMFLDLLVISIIWHAAYEFALLGSKLKNLNEKQAKMWITQHQDLISNTPYFLQNVSFIELSRFILVIVLSILWFLACSWAADKMTVMRCQKPITICMTGFQSAWSLKFCEQLLYTTFTFFSALKEALRA
ncbi:PREDICTED: uncharacterized protein LOC108552540 [Eufriesea mexicana]|uniref:uncharacterized protein LOC108552540 n=1 Tax=Eufriesea mexicana TaxID=516756 RepID=UPI00083C4CD9|nr:PREDICTED: uncharacterized protein LOC108552540 [Eufriesea mexicana]